MGEVESEGRAQYEEHQAQASPRQRVERVVLDSFDHDFYPDARSVAEVLVDEDVSAGEYEGCSVELEMAFTDYANIAEEVLR